MVLSHHFPLGSPVLHKTGIGNQWAVKQVVARKDGYLYLGNSKEDLHSNRAVRVLPSSEDLRPLGNYSDSFTIVIPKVMFLF